MNLIGSAIQYCEVKAAGKALREHWGDYIAFVNRECGTVILGLDCRFNSGDRCK